MKLYKINRNTVFNCLKENKSVEIHKKLGFNEIVKALLLIP